MPGFFLRNYYDTITVSYTRNDVIPLTVNYNNQIINGGANGKLYIKQWYADSCNRIWLL